MKPQILPNIYFGWIVVAVSMIAALVTFGIRSAPAVLIKPLESEFGWSRSEISGVIAIGLLFNGVAAVFGGALMDRVGPRRILTGAMALIAVSVLLASQMSAFWQFFVLWGVLNGAAAGAASMLGPTISNRWFLRRRGLVQGLFAGGTSAGLLIFLPALTWLIVNYGWREASVIAAVVALACVPLVWVFVRDSPAEMGLLPFGASADKAATSTKPQSIRVVMGNAVRAPEFWLLSGSFFICGATSTGLIGAHFVSHAIDDGYAEVTAASVLAIMGSMNFIGTIASGWLTDKHDPRVLLAMYYTLRGASLFILPAVTGFSGLTIFAIVFGLDYIATVPPTVSLTSNIFGSANVGTVYGWIFFAHQLGAALAAQATGIAHDYFGSYTLAFIAGGALSVLGGGLALRIEREPASTRAPTALPAG